MILLDADLDPDPAHDVNSAKHTAASPASAGSRKLVRPSARALARFLNQAQLAVRLKGHVTVLLTTDLTIRRLNREFRGQNKATDVLSFPADGLGDLAISVHTALRQAVEQGHSLSIEVKVLILHGLLHLAGYDHEADTGQMDRRERLLRARLGLPQGLIERAENFGKPEKPRTPSSRLPAGASVASRRPASKKVSSTATGRSARQ
jgi:probable rRNA maturation factor